MAGVIRQIRFKKGKNQSGESWSAPEGKACLLPKFPTRQLFFTFFKCYHRGTVLRLAVQPLESCDPWLIMLALVITRVSSTPLRPEHS